MDISTALAQLLEGHDIVVTISTRARSGAPAQDRPTADTSPSPTSTKKVSKKKAPEPEPEAAEEDGGDDWGSMFGPST
jgi:ribosomal protein L12E/L44/L45/RPP1/RPP2